MSAQVAGQVLSHLCYSSTEHQRGTQARTHAQRQGYETVSRTEEFAQHIVLQGVHFWRAGHLS